MTALEWPGGPHGGAVAAELSCRVSVAGDLYVAGSPRTRYENYNERGVGMDAGRETLRSLKALAEEIDTLRRDEFAAGFSALTAGSHVDQAVEDGYSDTEFAALHRDRLAKAHARKEALASVRQRLEQVGLVLEADASALIAERAAYAHALSAVAAVEKPPEAEEIHDDAPLKLERAVHLPELAGAFSTKTLRAAIAAGRLRILRPNTKNIYTTRRFIREWLESCQDQESLPISFSAAPAKTNKAEPPTRPPTSSKTALTSTARDAALTILQGLKKPSTTTSSGNTRKR